jgi:hypothetical protein
VRDSNPWPYAISFLAPGKKTVEMIGTAVLGIDHDECFDFFEPFLGVVGAAPDDDKNDK